MSKMLSLRVAHTLSMWTLLAFTQEELATFVEAKSKAMLSLSACQEIQANSQTEIKTLENIKCQFFKQFCIFFVLLIFFLYFVWFKSPLKF